MTKTDMPIIILAAGASSRMRGRDKLLELVDGAPLLRQQAIKALAVTDGDVLVALPVAPHPRYDALDGLRVQKVPIAQADEGMNASLRGAVAALPASAACAMLLLADLPDLTVADLALVASRYHPDSGTRVWRGATEDGKPGHPIVFKSEIFPEFAKLQGDSGGRVALEAAQGKIELIPLPGVRARRDLDTPEDLALWHAEQAASAPDR